MDGSGQRTVAGGDTGQMQRLKQGHPVAVLEIDEASLLQAGEAPADGFDGEPEPIGEIGAGAEFYDYDDKYKNGVAQLFIPARLPEDIAEEVRKTAVRAYNLLVCDGLSRVDFFVTEKEHKVILNEINTLPGFTSISMFPKLWENAGTPYSELLEKLIDDSYALVFGKLTKKLRREILDGAT